MTYASDSMDGETTIRLLKAIQDIKNHPPPRSVQVAPVAARSCNAAPAVMAYTIHFGVPDMDHLWRQLTAGESNKTLTRDAALLLKRLKKALVYLSADPRYPGLQSHEISPNETVRTKSMAIGLWKTEHPRQGVFTGCTGHNVARSLSSVSSHTGRRKRGTTSGAFIGSTDGYVAASKAKSESTLIKQNSRTFSRPTVWIVRLCFGLVITCRPYRRHLVLEESQRFGGEQQTGDRRRVFATRSVTFVARGI